MTDSIPILFSELRGAPGAIRTPDPLVRSQVLYPTELRAQRISRIRRIVQINHCLFKRFLMLARVFACGMGFQ